jgi:hypothetical protein
MASFGWSTSDLLFIVQTVGTIIDALDKADGAAAQYQSTTLFLKTLQNTLHHLRSATALGLDPSYTAAVHAQVDLIKSPLADFIGEISKYEKSLGALSTRDSLRALPRKLQWAFGVEQNVSKLERKIAGPLSCISILLTQQAMLICPSDWSVSSSPLTLPVLLYQIFKKTFLLRYAVPLPTSSIKVSQNAFEKSFSLIVKPQQKIPRSTI